MLRMYLFSEQQKQRAPFIYVGCARYLTPFEYHPSLSCKSDEKFVCRAKTVRQQELLVLFISKLNGDLSMVGRFKLDIEHVVSIGVFH